MSCCCCCCCSKAENAGQLIRSGSKTKIGVRSLPSPRRLPCLATPTHPPGARVHCLTAAFLGRDSPGASRSSECSRLSRRDGHVSVRLPFCAIYPKRLRMSTDFTNSPIGHLTNLPGFASCCIPSIRPATPKRSYVPWIRFVYAPIRAIPNFDACSSERGRLWFSFLWS